MNIKAFLERRETVLGNVASPESEINQQMAMSKRVTNHLSPGLSSDLFWFCLAFSRKLTKRSATLARVRIVFRSQHLAALAGDILPSSFFSCSLIKPWRDHPWGHSRTHYPPRCHLVTFNEDKEKRATYNDLKLTH